MSAQTKRQRKHRSDRERGYSVKDPESLERKEEKLIEKEEEKRVVSLTHTSLSRN